MNKKSAYITTTLPYVNAPLHMGHALEFVRADAIVRYKKLIGQDVFFNTGTDEHGSKIYKKAVEAGLSPQAFVDEGFRTFKEQVMMFGVSEDVHYVRTTDQKHIRIAQAFWKRVKDNGYIYKSSYKTKYCVGCESEKTDSELSDDFCEFHPGVPIELIDEENYFFKYSAFSEQLKSHFKAHQDFVIPAFRKKEMESFIENGLEDFSISRLKEKMPWGISVPEDEEHVMYVWFDALTNYISTLATESTESLDELLLSETFKQYWENGQPVQYCGKDNTRFQSLMWQAMLLAAQIPLSHTIVVNGFITADGGVRMSKTLGNTVDPRDIVSEFGSDALRMFLLSEISNFEDSPFTKERFVESYNAKLANGLGNLTSRILTLSEKYLTECPEIPETSIPQKFFDALEVFDISGACAIIFEEIGEMDKYITEHTPFKTIKIDEELGKKQISELVLRLYTVARMLHPIMPETNVLLKKLIKSNKKPSTPLFVRKEKTLI